VSEVTTLRGPGWAWLQLLGALFGAPIIGWTSHAYVTHLSDEVTVTGLAGYAIVLSLLWGFAPMIGSALLHPAKARQKLANWLGVVGALLACGWYFLGIWIFTFRYPPHSSLYTMELAAAIGGVIALSGAIAQVPGHGAPAVQQGAEPDEAHANDRQRFAG
jgi:hypothetical protein